MIILFKPHVPTSKGGFILKEGKKEFIYVVYRNDILDNVFLSDLDARLYMAEQMLDKIYAEFHLYKMSVDVIDYKMMISMNIERD